MTTINDNRFHQLDENEACAVLCSGGVFTQAKVYRRGDRLFAGYGKGFIGLSVNGGTTKPRVSWDTLELPDGMSFKPNTLGRLVVA